MFIILFYLKYKSSLKLINDADLKLMLLPKQRETPLKEDEKGITIQVASADFIRFEHPSPDHHKENIIVITSNRKDNVNNVLK